MLGTAPFGLRTLLAVVVAATAIGVPPALAQAPSTTLPKLTLPGLASPPAATSAPPVAISNSSPSGGGQQVVQAPWTKICSTDPSTKKNVCAVRLEVVDSTGQQLLASATVQTKQDDPKMLLIISVPPGMLLQPGVQVVVDTNKPMPMAYSVCVPNACYADMDFTAENLKALRAGKQFTIAAINEAGQQVSMPISLTGFAKVYDGPGADPNSPSGQAAVDALTLSLQQHAEQARQALTNQQQAPNAK
jgi:invasion protein IalB